MKKRCFPRYDVQIDARFCADGAPEEWIACRVTKISRKGIGVVFAADKAALIGSMLTFSLSIARESEAIILRGELKWTRQLGGNTVGGVELNSIVGEAEWLQLIYFIRRPCDEKPFVSLHSMPDHRTLNKSLHPAPAKVEVPALTAMDHIRNILNYKIL